MFSASRPPRDAAPAPPPCPKQVVEKGALRLTTHWHARLAKCSLSVGPRDLVAPSRSLTVASDGRVMVFNTFRPVDETIRDAIAYFKATGQTA